MTPRRRHGLVVVVAVTLVAIVAGVNEHRQQAENDRRVDELYCQMVDDLYEYAPRSGDLCLTVLTGGNR
jgi:hypothetical protein